MNALLERVALSVMSVYQMSHTVSVVYVLWHSEEHVSLW